MRFSVTVRCLFCGYDDLDTLADDCDIESLSRINAVCCRCGRVYRLSLTMCSIKGERLRMNGDQVPTIK